VAFQFFVVLVFIWLGDGSRLSKSCLHDLGVPYHHFYRVSSPLLVEFISFWYQSFVVLVFIQFSVPCCVKKKKKNKTKTKKQKQKQKEEKVQNSSKKKSSFQSCLSKKIVIVPERKIASFQSCFSKKIVPVPARKILPFSLVSHLI
jgi:hypothetical protein